MHASPWRVRIAQLPLPRTLRGAFHRKFTSDALGRGSARPKAAYPRFLMILSRKPCKESIPAAPELLSHSAGARGGSLGDLSPRLSSRWFQPGWTAGGPDLSHALRWVRSRSRTTERPIAAKSRPDRRKISTRERSAHARQFFLCGERLRRRVGSPQSENF